MGKHKLDNGATSNPSGLLLRSFHTLSLTLLTLLLPLSFLLLSRLESVPRLLSTPNPPSENLFSIFLDTSLFILHLLVPVICSSALVHASVGYLPRLHLNLAWAVLSIFQVSVGLGIEATIMEGIGPVELSEVGMEGLVQRAVFFVGVYETTLFWSRVFVRGVVDDTIYGVGVEETNSEKLVMGVVFGVVWVGMLRNEVEGLILAQGVGWHGLVCELVGFLIVMVGMVRIVRGIVWMGKHLTSYQIEAEGPPANPEILEAGRV